MEIKLKLLFFLLAGMLFLIGCTQQPFNQNQTTNQTSNPMPTPPANNTQVPSANNVSITSTPLLGKTTPMVDMYKFDSVKTYTYKETWQWEGQGINTAGIGNAYMLNNPVNINTTTTISSDALNGTATWLQESHYKGVLAKPVSGMSNFTDSSEAWLDKSTLQCLKSNEPVNEYTVVPIFPCTSDYTAILAVQFNYVDTETLTLPAGTFQADKYMFEHIAQPSVTYTLYIYVAKGVPVPVEMLEVREALYNGQTLHYYDQMELVSYS